MRKTTSMSLPALKLAAVLLLAAAAILPAAAQAKAWSDIKYPALPAFPIPKPQVVDLPNGMKVFLLEDRELPLISVTALVRAGANWEPAGKIGLAGLTGSVQRTGGTAKMTGDQIDDFLAARAASVETFIGDDAGSASMDCLGQDFDAVLPIFADVLRRPAFAQDKLDVAKVQANAGIARRNDNVGGITGREIAKLVYGADSPIARQTEYATIAAIARQDLVDFHAKYYHPNNVYLGVVGDFDSKEMLAKLQAAFGDWPKGPAFDGAAVPYRTTPNPGLFFIEKSDVNQANIVLAELGIEQKNPDYFPVQVMNEAFGGGFSARLFSNVRSKKGLAYSVRGSLGADFLYPGMFQAGLQTASSNMSRAIDAMKFEINDLVANPPSDDEIRRAKESILNSFIFNYDSRRKILGQQLSYAFYGLPADYLETYRANIEKVTREDVARVAKQYVKPENLSVLVVGKAADFDKPLAELGTVTTLDIAIPPPPAAGPKVEKTAASLAAGKAAWQRAVQAMTGGKPFAPAALETVSSIALTQPMAMTLKQTSLAVFPDRRRTVQVLPMGEQVTVLDGAGGFVQMGPRSMPLAGEQLERTSREFARQLTTLLRYAGDPGLEAVAAGKETVDGVAAEIVQITYRGAETRLWIGPDGRVIKQAHSTMNPATRAPGNAEILLSDWRETGGVKLPFKQVTRFDGQEAATATIESVTLDPKVDPALFAKPAA
ncbi:MAG: insulinase family protein [Acidobacteria bacterium]|nr:insulinase family protein [Acidobacteriota bacterium]